MITYSRSRLSGGSKGNPSPSVICARPDAPIPSRTLPGARSSITSTWLASANGWRVNAGTIAVPRRTRSVRAAAAANRVAVSRPVAAPITAQPVPTPAASARATRSRKCSVSVGPNANPARPLVAIVSDPITRRCSFRTASVPTWVPAAIRP